MGDDCMGYGPGTAVFFGILLVNSTVLILLIWRVIADIRKVLCTWGEKRQTRLSSRTNNLNFTETVGFVLMSVVCILVATICSLIWRMLWLVSVVSVDGMSKKNSAPTVVGGDKSALDKFEVNVARPFLFFCLLFTILTYILVITIVIQLTSKQKLQVWWTERTKLYMTVFGSLYVLLVIVAAIVCGWGLGIVLSLVLLAFCCMVVRFTSQQASNLEQTLRIIGGSSEHTLRGEYHSTGDVDEHMDSNVKSFFEEPASKSERLLSELMLTRYYFKHVHMSTVTALTFAIAYFCLTNTIKHISGYLEFSSYMEIGTFRIIHEILNCSLLYLQVSLVLFLNQRVENLFVPVEHYEKIEQASRDRTMYKKTKSEMEMMSLPNRQSTMGPQMTNEPDCAAGV